jgi:rhodanese-related sulfurtransferase
MSKIFSVSARCFLMRHIISLFAVLGLALCANAEEDRRVRWIDVDNLKTILQEKKPVVIDLRTPGEFERGHLPGAVNLPIGELSSRPSRLDEYKDKPILFYCRTVNKTARAIRLIEDRGFKSIYALRGGYEAIVIYDRF